MAPIHSTRQLRKHCAQCGAVFLVAVHQGGHPKKYCSQRCRNRFRYPNRYKTKHCIQCGKKFVSSVRYPRQTCSSACLSARMSDVGRKHHPNLRPFLQCLHCGVTFRKRKRSPSQRDSNKYCSRECSVQHKRAIAEQKLVERLARTDQWKQPRVCQVCQQSFVPKSQNQVVCATCPWHAKRYRTLCCIVCGKQVHKPGMGRWRYCSYACMREVGNTARPLLVGLRDVPVEYAQTVMELQRLNRELSKRQRGER
jgi:hypothetical protein